MPADLWLFLTGFVAGAANAVSGGGTFLAFPVLIAVARLPTVAANATCTVGLLPGMVASTGGYFRDLLAQLRSDARRQILPSDAEGLVVRSIRRVTPEAINPSHGTGRHRKLPAHEIRDNKRIASHLDPHRGPRFDNG